MNFEEAKKHLEFLGVPLHVKTEWVEGGENICHNENGFCLFETLDQVKKLSTSWRKREKDLDQTIKMRPVRVSWELPNGFEFTGPVQLLP